MTTKEIMEGSYMQALLRAALLLGELRRAAPVHEITISGFRICNRVRKLYPQCRIIATDSRSSHPPAVVVPPSLGENYLILYPLRSSLPS